MGDFKVHPPVKKWKQEAVIPPVGVHSLQGQFPKILYVLQLLVLSAGKGDFRLLAWALYLSFTSTVG